MSDSEIYATDLGEAHPQKQLERVKETDPETGEQVEVMKEVERLNLVKGSGMVNWRQIRRTVSEWAFLKTLVREEMNVRNFTTQVEESEYYVAEIIRAILGSTDYHHQGEDECPMGLTFVSALEISS